MKFVATRIPKLTSIGEGGGGGNHGGSGRGVDAVTSLGSCKRSSRFNPKPYTRIIAREAELQNALVVIHPKT